MRAITLIRPMAAAIIHGTKRIENRPRDLPKSMRGVSTIVAVHAGKAWDDEYWDTIRRIDGRPGISADGDSPLVPAYERRVLDEGLIGLMRLTGRVFTNTWNVRERHGGDSRWFSGPFGYEIDRVVAFASPIPCRGMLGWWTVPEAHESVWERALQQIKIARPENPCMRCGAEAGPYWCSSCGAT